MKLDEMYLVLDGATVEGSTRVKLATHDLALAVAEYHKDVTARTIVKINIQGFERIDVCAHCGRPLEG